MKIAKILLSAFFAVTALGASAQGQKYVIDEVKSYTVFKKHAYLQLQGGAQHTLGEAKFMDLVSPNAQIALGYQFSPVFGARIQANAWQSKGGISGYGPSQQRTTETFKWNYVAPGIDAMFNLTNLFGGFNPQRCVNVNAFLGVGANIAWGNDEAAALLPMVGDGAKENMSHLWNDSKLLAPVGRAGIGVDFRLSDAVSLGIEGNANCLNDQYNSKHTDNPDWYFNALVGLKINLGKTYETKNDTVGHWEAIPVPIACPACGSTNVNGGCPETEKGACVNDPNCKHPASCYCKQPKVIEVRGKKIDVFFLIRSSVISEEENVKVQEMIKYLQKYPDAKVVVTGYADIGTGNPRINMGYSEKRAEVVTKALLDAGISMDRITTDAKGDTVQPFAENDLNRVTIAIAD